MEEVKQVLRITTKFEKKDIIRSSHEPMTLFK